MAHKQTADQKNKKNKQTAEVHVTANEAKMKAGPGNATQGNGANKREEVSVNSLKQRTGRKTTQ